MPHFQMFPDATDFESKSIVPTWKRPDFGSSAANCPFLQISQEGKHGRGNPAAVLNRAGRIRTVDLLTPSQAR